MLVNSLIVKLLFFDWNFFWVFVNLIIKRMFKIVIFKGIRIFVILDMVLFVVGLYLVKFLNSWLVVFFGFFIVFFLFS